MCRSVRPFGSTYCVVAPCIVHPETIYHNISALIQNTSVYCSPYFGNLSRYIFKKSTIEDIAILVSRPTIMVFPHTHTLQYRWQCPCDMFLPYITAYLSWKSERLVRASQFGAAVIGYCVNGGMRGCDRAQVAKLKQAFSFTFWNQRRALISNNWVDRYGATAPDGLAEIQGSCLDGSCARSRALKHHRARVF